MLLGLWPCATVGLPPQDNFLELFDHIKTMKRNIKSGPFAPYLLLVDDDKSKALSYGHQKAEIAFPRDLGTNNERTCGRKVGFMFA